MSTRLVLLDKYFYRGWTRLVRLTDSGAMHELGRYLQREMDLRGWKPADLSRHTGITKQTISNLLTDPREFMDQTPRRPTLEGLANGLGVPLSNVLTAAAQAIGAIPDAATQRSDLSQVPDEVLTRELAARLRALRQEAADYATNMSQAGETPAKPKGKKVPYVDPHAHPDADSAGNVPLPANWYELAASSGRNYGAEEDARARERGEETQDTENED